MSMMNILINKNKNNRILRKGLSEIVTILIIVVIAVVA